MAISGVNPKCYILALFVRDDGTRFLLGDDPFEFKDNQLHFQQNTMANDVVEVQGNDGYLLAGQVRRPGTQMFDGYVCNGTNSKEEVEVKRRAFLQFFRRSHFYKVIYVFPNGTAIQRKQGFLVDDPTVQELYQQYPAYHVALNFEDVNYYTYEEDDQGHEIYAKEAIVPLARGGATGGLSWDSYGVVWEDPWSLPLSISGVQFQILNNSGARAPIDNVKLYGDTYQQTYSGKNLLHGMPATIINNGVRTTWDNTTATFSGKSTSGYSNITGTDIMQLEAGATYTLSTPHPVSLFDFKIRVRYDNANHNVVLGKNQTSVTFTIPDEASNPGIRIMYIEGFATDTEFNSSITLQLELGSPATSFEPYVGGLPAPSPDYPQDIQVVTGEQTVNISDGVSSQSYKIDLTGKNLWNPTPYKYGYYLSNSGVETSSAYASIYGNIMVNPNDTLTLSYTPSASGNIRIHAYNASGTWLSLIHWSSVTKDIPFSATFTVPSGATYIRWSCQVSIDDNNLAQVELGSATPYTPYYNYELCKISDYQDYIYKSDDDWYVHKATGKIIVDGSYGGYNSTFNWYYCAAAQYGGESPSSSAVCVGNLFRYIPFVTFKPNTSLIGMSVENGGFRLRNTACSSASDYQTWLSNNNLILYYQLATPTDTKITDATLVGQLEALDAMKLLIGENNVLVSTPTPNLPATLAFDYYTKFATIGAEWEEGGTKGATIVDVDAIDNTYPVWELTGPATNPTLSVLTTNTALTYNGTITASQKLVIDMFNKTATLNGTSVIGNISGDFVYMAPGTNRLAYTAGNTDAPDSTIYWQEVVG